MSCWLVAGLGYGDEGKGSITDALVRQHGADLVIRYNGGCQAAHNVVLPDGRHHTFCQFGSGTFVGGCRTYLSRFTLINPIQMLHEEEKLQEVGVVDAFSRMYVDKKAVIITPYQKALNRLQEISRGVGRHGSTGMGIGIAREDHIRYGNLMLMAGDLCSPKRTNLKMEFIRKRCQERAYELKLSRTEQVNNEFHYIDGHSSNWYLDQYHRWFNQVNVVDAPPANYTGLVFEGAQGMLLDEKHGFQPHVTWTDITFNNAETILREMNYIEEVHKIGILRSYYTRHGDGPFPSEDASLLTYPALEEQHNKSGEYMGGFRLGHFDMPLALYAINCINGVDSLAINHMDMIDRMEGGMRVRVAKNVLANVTQSKFLDTIKTVLNVPISILGFGPTHSQKLFL